ncbi:Uncharacterized protein TCM_005967 [Theobroma cacao]|uniref:Uncharacterized protein n=1 Tax=Theobroma cacao TaxID=3641 RepID=A0A061DVJ4_THECC|nr:Uncharacterized protein TCM_005967 [Theobroma cacao]
MDQIRPGEAPDINSFFLCLWCPRPNARPLCFFFSFVRYSSMPFAPPIFSCWFFFFVLFSLSSRAGQEFGSCMSLPKAL